MSDTLGLHRMENPSHSNAAISLHLYTPPYERCQTFDERTSQCKEAFVLFDTSKDGEYNKRRKATQNLTMDFNNNKRCCREKISTKFQKITN
uniref:Cysteine dioxygenase n=1 Tax=Panagrolaimus sp. PS1159 TaxID=55785 RepID=A0AC35EYP4_9BILA